MKNFDTMLVGFDHSHGDPAVLIVGRKAPGDNVRIINQFQGKEAEELYRKLGKIDFVEFGSMKDYPFQLGLQLGFSMSGSGVMDGGKYTVNMSPDCHWEIGTRHTNLAESLDRVAKILNDAKVNYISELLGKPVEVTLEDGMFKEFRILTEVL